MDESDIRARRARALEWTQALNEAFETAHHDQELANTAVAYYVITCFDNGAEAISRDDAHLMRLVKIALQAFENYQAIGSDLKRAEIALRAAQAALRAARKAEQANA